MLRKVLVVLFLAGVVSRTVNAKPRERRAATADSPCIHYDEEYYDGHCYLMITEQNDWATSSKMCEDLQDGYKLASITTFSEHEFLRNRLMADYRNSDYWIGVERVNSIWQLISGDPWLNTIWAEDGDDEGADCARLREIDDFFMNDRACDRKFGAICKRSSDSIQLEAGQIVCAGDEYKFENYCYKVNAELMESRADARDQCLRDGYYLASISSQPEHDFIKGILASQQSQDYWVGASLHSGNWIWLGGDDWYDGIWSANGNIDTSVNCAVLKGIQGFALHSESCTARHGYVSKRVADTLPLVHSGMCDVALKKNTCYIVSNHKATWNDAQEYCAAMGGVLANFEKKVVRKGINKLVADKNFDIWMGLHDLSRKNHPYWSCGSKLGETNVEKEYPWKETVADIEGQSCVKLTPNGQEYDWQYDDCEQKFHYMCKIVGIEDKPVRATLEEKEHRLKADRKVHKKDIMAVVEEINSNMPPEELELMVESDIRMKPEWVEVMKRDNLSPKAAMDFFNDKGKSASAKQGSRRRRNALNYVDSFWPDAVVPYEFDPSAQLSYEDKQVVFAAMNIIESRTCVQWVQRTDQQDFITIFPGYGCWSYLGRIGYQQYISFGEGCLQNVGTAIHEMLHALGFFHEHSRCDRDDYIDINYDNVQAGMEYNFLKYTASDMDIQNIGYDYSSILHYHQYAFAVDKNIPTVVPSKPSSSYIGQRNSLSEIDVKEVNKIYNCPAPIINGGFSQWSLWSSCSQTCGGGIRSRSRECNQPTPSVSPTGAPCDGAFDEESLCMILECPSGLNRYTWLGCYNDKHVPEILVTLEDTSNPYLDGHYEVRTEKAKKCAQAAAYVGHDIFAMRFGGKCYSMSTLEEGPDFYKSEGPARECVDGFGAPDSIDVYSLTDHVDGGWSVWSDYNQCSEGGIKTRTRECNNPSPSIGGNYCEGSSTEDKVCNIHCPIDGGWSEWVSGDCTASCGSGTIISTRECNNPYPAYGGSGCLGSSMKEEECNIAECIIVVDGGWSEWMAVGDCSAECGSGTQSYMRECNNPVPQNGGQQCEGEVTMDKICNNGECPVDGVWSDWTPVGTCSVPCGSGTLAYIRSCSNPPPANGGLDCVGPTTKEEDCFLTPCPVNGKYSDWEDWTECDKSCGGGHQTRTRACDSPPPQYGGNDCKDEGPYLETRSCNDFYCAIDGGWTDWSDWGPCEPDCNDGYQSQSRSCTNPKPMYGGFSCEGNATTIRSCDYLDIVCEEPGPEIINPPVLSELLNKADIFYPMDNIRGKDIFGSPRDIVAMGTAELDDQDSRYGRSLNLHEGDWVDAGDWAGSCISSPVFCQEGFTISFWLKIDTEQLLGRTSYLLSSGGQLWSSSQGISIYITSKGMLKTFLRYGEKEYTVDMTSDMLKSPIWHHIAISGSKSNGLLMYYKGQPFNWDYYGRDAQTPDDEGSSSFNIGKSNDARFSSVVARLDEVAVWYHILSDNEVYEIFRAVPDDCQDCDSFATCDGQQQCICNADFVGDGCTCQINSEFSAGLDLVPLPIPMYFWPMDIIQSNQVQGSEPIFSEGEMLVSNGIEEGAVFFNGRRDWLNVGDFRGKCLSYPDDCVEGFSYAFWMKFYGRAVDTVKNFILSSGAQAPAQTGISMYAEGIDYYLAVQDTAYRYEITQPFQTRYWHHYVITWSKTDGLKLYIDGDLIAESKGKAHTAIRNSPNNLAIGKPNHANVWNGEFIMDNLAIFEQPLQMEEVQSVFLGGVEDTHTYQKRHARSAEKLMAFNKKKLAMKRKK
ncbi:uncharacterized protein LOC144451387 isoform X2 [Glandiceps talaboti]